MHWALGIGHRELGIGHRASGIGHWSKEQVRRSLLRIVDVSAPYG
ncbi:MAG: hypothetical protein WBA89_19265 [Microcoleus sp.]